MQLDFFISNLELLSEHLSQSLQTCFLWPEGAWETPSRHLLVALEPLIQIVCDKNF